ncbi:asparagine synthase (glutamine-hydrolyzing) [Tenacibaculum amylolyticum]|uniref:asparagine synthase (glutamine-hydrolyzing) n=1 Tax=Tenacibaculum amylolyticum TaxID=104269 RepID=UPI003893C8CF
MCGIAGFISNNENQIDGYVSNTVESINHRGPDEHGYHHSENVCLLNTRLSIIDIENGKQPFYNNNKEIVVVQNGEIYNFVEVKNELIKLGCTFETSSDTEVILKAYESYGTECFSKFNGMFAIAIYDKKLKKVILGRDRLGVKPLYLYEKDNGLYFASEIKAFKKAIQDFDGSLDNQSIHNYLKFNYIPIPRTIFKYVTHVIPGSFIEIDTESLSKKVTKYWDITNQEELVDVTEEEAFEQIDEIFTDAIRIRLRSDVGIGAFLSGGLDSSLVCAATKEKFGISLDSYSIGFKEKRFDESYWAKTVANHCDIENKVHILESDIVKMWNLTTWHNDQPHGDISFIPTYILSEFAAKDYKLVFTGDGGDEAFAGYTKYFSSFDSDEKNYFDSISLIKKDEDFDNLYTSNFKESVDYSVPFKIFRETIDKVSNKDFTNKILYFDMIHLLPGNNLVKPDKMAMANSLETRSPLLDYRLFEYTQKLKGNFKLRENETKYILKKYALKYLPKDVVYRDKQMFTVPVGEWFKTHLKDYVTEIINSDSLSKRNIFNSSYLKEILKEHIEGKKDYTRELRAIVNLELWFRCFID